MQVNMHFTLGKKSFLMQIVICLSPTLDQFQQRNQLLQTDSALIMQFSFSCKSLFSNELPWQFSNWQEFSFSVALIENIIPINLFGVLQSAFSLFIGYVLLKEGYSNWCGLGKKVCNHPQQRTSCAKLELCILPNNAGMQNSVHLRKFLNQKCRLAL